MAIRNDGETNGYTLQWKIDNFSNSWWLKEEGITSPTFIADTLEGTKWSLQLYAMGDGKDDTFTVYLKREKNCLGPDMIEVNFHLGIQSKDGSFLLETTLSDVFRKDEEIYCLEFEDRESIFVTNREDTLPEDTLTLQCTIWKTKQKPAKPKHLYARTVLEVNRKSFVWRIDKFSTLKSSPRNKVNNSIVNFDLILNKEQGFDKKFFININSLDESIKYFSFKVSVIDLEGEKVNCGIDRYFIGDLMKGVLLSTVLLPEKLMEPKSQYLLNDVLSLYCEFVFVTEVVSYKFIGYEMLNIKLKNEAVKNRKEDYVRKEKSQNTTILIDDLKSMYNNGICSDTEVRTSTKTFPAHRAILSARSPVFRRMFSIDMKENNSGHINITDLEDDTIQRMLLYLYTDLLEDLQFESASSLYVAADKYEILSLKSRCCSFLKDNLCPTRVCDVLILADLHQDNDLRNAAQAYILKHDHVFNSLEWERFMETNIKLAADIMFKKVKAVCNVSM